MINFFLGGGGSEVYGIVHHYFFPEMAAGFHEVEVDRIGLIAVLIGGIAKEQTPGNRIGAIDHVAIGRCGSSDMEGADGFYLAELFKAGDELVQIGGTIGVMKPEVHVVDESLFSVHIV